MEKEQEFFNDIRISQIDCLINILNELKDDSNMFIHKSNKELYKKQIDDIFNTYEKGMDYMSFKIYFEKLNNI